MCRLRFRRVRGGTRREKGRSPGAAPQTPAYPADASRNERLCARTDVRRSAALRGRRPDRRGIRPEALHVGGVNRLPALRGGPWGRLAVEVVDEQVQARVPARPVARRLAVLVEAVDEE